MKQNFKGIIFDIDGTLLDSMNVWSDIDVRFLAKRGLRVPDDYLKTVAALGLKRAAVYTRDLFDLKEELADIENEWLQMAMDEYRDNVKAKAGAVEYFAAANVGKQHTRCNGNEQKRFKAFTDCKV